MQGEHLPQAVTALGQCPSPPGSGPWTILGTGTVPQMMGQTSGLHWHRWELYRHLLDESPRTLYFHMPGICS